MTELVILHPSFWRDMVRMASLLSLTKVLASLSVGACVMPYLELVRKDTLMFTSPFACLVVIQVSHLIIPASV